MKAVRRRRSGLETEGALDTRRWRRGSKRCGEGGLKGAEKAGKGPGRGLDDAEGTRNPR